MHFKFGTPEHPYEESQIKLKSHATWIYKLHFSDVGC